MDSRAVRSFSSAAVSTLLLAWLAGQVVAGHTASFDAAVRNTIHSWASPLFTVAMQFFTNLGAGIVMFVLTTVGVLLFWLYGQKRKGWTFAVAMSGALLLETLLKLAVHRARPVPFFGLESPDSYSFPSGHALLSFTFFMTLAALAAPGKIAAWIVAAFITLMIGLSRIYLGVHYPSDVIGGYLTAFAWVSALCGTGLPARQD